MIEADLIILDFDDTLVLTEEATFRIENIVAVSLGHPPMGREIHIQTWGHPLAEAIAQRIPGIDVAKFMDIIATLIPQYAASGEIDTIPEQNLETLENLLNLGKKLAILTSRSLGEVQHLIDPGHHLNQYVERFYYKGHGSYTKPNPKVFNNPLTDFGIPPHRSVYIGDSIGDGIAANGARLPFIVSLESGHRSVLDFKGIRVDAFISKFPEILDVII